MKQKINPSLLYFIYLSLYCNLCSKIQCYICPTISCKSLFTIHRSLLYSRQTLVETPKVGYSTQFICKGDAKLSMFLQASRILTQFMRQGMCVPQYYIQVHTEYCRDDDVCIKIQEDWALHQRPNYTICKKNIGLMGIYIGTYIYTDYFIVVKLENKLDWI